MKIHPATLALLAVAITGAAHADDGAPETVTALDQVAGISWQLVSITIGDEQFPGDGEVGITLAITEKGEVSGRSAVNRYFGKLSIDAEGKLSWEGALGSTRMAGPPHLMASEQRYLRSLPETSSIALVDGRLRLAGEEGNPTLIFSQPED